MLFFSSLTGRSTIRVKWITICPPKNLSRITYHNKDWHDTNEANKLPSDLLWPSLLSRVIAVPTTAFFSSINQIKYFNLENFRVVSLTYICGVSYRCLLLLIFQITLDFLLQIFKFHEEVDSQHHCFQQMSSFQMLRETRKHRLRPRSYQGQEIFLYMC